jgi:hypothetical protein
MKTSLGALALLCAATTAANGVEVLEFPTSSPGRPGFHQQGVEPMPVTDYRHWDTFFRCCRPGDSDQNWAGSDSWEVWGDLDRDHPDYPGMRAQNDGKAYDRQAILITDGWLDEVNATGQQIIKAEYEVYMRFHALEPDGETTRGIRAHPMLIDTRDNLGWVRGGTSFPGAMEASFHARSTNVIDQEAEVGWGDGTGHFGPVAGIDYDPSSSSDSIVISTMFDAGHDTKHRIDITPMAQAWQRGDIPNNGVILVGLNAGDMVGDTVLGGTVSAYFHGADAGGDPPGGTGALDIPDSGPRANRFFPVLFVTVPEPATIGLLGLGGLLALARRRR